MLLTKKFKTVLVVLIILSVIILPTAFCVSYAKWTGGSPSINASVSVGAWSDSAYYVAFINKNRVVAITADSQTANPTCTGNFTVEVGDTFYVYYNGQRVSLAPKTAEGIIAVVSQKEDDLTVYKANVSGDIGINVSNEGISFYNYVSLSEADDQDLLNMLDQMLKETNPNASAEDTRGMVTSHGQVVELGSFSNGATVTLEVGEQLKIFIYGKRADINAVVNNHEGLTYDSATGIYTVADAGTYKITADQFILKGVSIVKQ